MGINAAGRFQPIPFCQTREARRLRKEIRERISLTIDDQRITVSDGTTVLEAAEGAGIRIPHLCYLPGKDDPVRPCLLCMVEVEGRGRVRACSTLAEPGMVVHAHTGDLKEFRRQRLQALAASHYGDCRAPCNLTCPGGINVQGYVNLIAQGEYEAALRVIKEKNPLPASVGRVCPRFCETRCRRILLDEHVAINSLKRFVADYALEHGFNEDPPAPPTGKKVAIIGGGPAGLSASYYLRKLGHEVVIFEARDKLGGMLRYGIPGYKLPKRPLDREIQGIVDMGVHVKTGKRWGEDFDIKDLLGHQGFGAVFIATGLSRQRALEVEGGELAIDGLGFLGKINEGQPVEVDKRVLVIGGGDIAVDAARCAKRLGARDVTLIYPRSRVELPAPQRDVTEAEKEGVQFYLMSMPLRLSEVEGGIRVEMARTVLGEPDSRGLRYPVPMPGSRLLWTADTVISALGQEGDAAFQGYGEIESAIKLTPRKTIRSNPSTMKTNVRGVYAGGDVASGPRTVIQAVAAGRRAAEAIHEYLTGEQVGQKEDRFNFSRGRRLEDMDMHNFDGYPIRLSEVMPARPPERRIGDLDEVELGLTEEMALREAKRCLQCGCLGLSKCIYRRLSKDHKVNTKGAPVRLQYPIKNDHPSIRIDPNKCVACHRCERSCEFGALELSYREEHGIITEKAITIGESCVSCGACVDACPTGALVKRHVFLPLFPGEGETTRSICTYCGTGCNIRVHTKHDVILEVKADTGEPPNYGDLCVKGRFGFEFQRHPDRLTRPLVREDRDEPFCEVSWEDALDLVARKLSAYRGDEFAALSSAKCTNEENYVFQRFVRVVMGTNNIDHCARLCHAPTLSALAATFGSGAMTNSIGEIGGAACILAIGTNTVENHPVIFLQIRKAIKNGCRLIVADPREIGLCRLAHIWLRHNPGTDVPLLMGMARVILDENLLDTEFIGKRCENFEAFKASLSNFEPDWVSDVTGVPVRDIVAAARTFARNPPASILYAMGITQHSHGTDNVTAVSNLALITGNVGRPSAGVNPLRGQNNVQGSCDMGALPAFYPGYQQVADPAVKEKFERAWGCALTDRPGLYLTEVFDAINRGRVKAMYIMGENPALSDPDARHVVEALKRLEFLVVQDIFLTETAKNAHVVLPAACSYEKEGTFTNTERRIQRVRKAVRPPGEARADWKIICDIARRMGSRGFDYAGPKEIMDEIAKLTPSYGGINYSRLENSSLQWPCPDKDHPGTRYLHAEGFTRGKGRFIPLSYKYSIENPDSRYPFILTTGRNLFHYHTGTMTRKCSVLNQMQDAELVELNPIDARYLGIEDGDTVMISSRRGEVRAKARVTERSPRGVAFMTFHFAETPTNQLTSSALDPVAGIPEFKVCAVNIKKLSS